MLTITAGRFFLISPLMEGSTFAHRTSLRFIDNILECGLSPFHGFVAASLKVSPLLKQKDGVDCMLRESQGR